MAVTDSARQWTDEQLKEIENYIRQIYQQAQNEINDKIESYMRRTELRLSELYSAYQNAPADKKDAAKERYQKALQNATLQNKHFKAIRDEATARLANVNGIAIDYMNGKLPPIYTLNYNYIEPDMMTSGIFNAGISFNLVDESTIRRMIVDGNIKLPFKKLNISKDIAWNTKAMNSAILQGIIQGDSISKIADRLMNIVDNNRKAAVRNARTLVTGAENRGRIDRYKDLENQGVVMNKVWLATGDGRTRDWHLDMDEQEVGVDEVFYDGLGNQLEYPGDPGAPPETVYNCRCSMRSHVVGIKGKNGKIKYMPNYEHDNLHKEQIEEERERRKNGGGS